MGPGVVGEGVGPGGGEGPGEGPGRSGEGPGKGKMLKNGKSFNFPKLRSLRVDVVEGDAEAKAGGCGWLPGSAAEVKSMRTERRAQAATMLNRAIF